MILRFLNRYTVKVNLTINVCKQINILSSSSRYFTDQTLTNLTQSPPPQIGGGGQSITNFGSRAIKFFENLSQPIKALGPTKSSLWLTDQGLKILGGIC
jgi:hypothetical protein